MFILSSFLAIAGGTIISLQKLINSSLGGHIGNMESSFANHLVGAIFAGFLLIVGIRTGNIYFSGIPLHYFLGGCLGVFLVFFINYAIPVVGAMATLICLIISQLLVSSVIDHLGLWNADIIQFNWQRGVGIILIVCGAALVLSKKKSGKLLEMIDK